MGNDFPDMSTDDTDDSNTHTKTPDRKRKYSSKEEAQEHKKTRKRRRRKVVDPEQHSRDLEHRKQQSWSKQDYVDLLNEMKHDARARPYLASDSMSSKFNSVNLQDGIVIWTAKERHALAEELARNNMNNFGLLAAAIPKKSLFEILAFQHTMSEASAIHDLHGRPVEQLRPEQIPAASELSAECCDVLEKAASHICKLEWKGDCRHEEMLYGEHYLLTVDDAQRFEDRMAHSERNIGTGTFAAEQDGIEAGFTTLNADVTKAMVLLDLRLLLHLSEKFYGVSGREETSSLRDALDHDAKPSIFASALIDLQNVVYSVTRRLIDASIFQASTRLRANDRRTSKLPKLRVKRKDVLAAAETIHMLHNSVGYWQDAPRRLELKVYRTVPGDKLHRKHFLSTNEYTQLLRHKRSRHGVSAAGDSEPDMEQKLSTAVSEVVTNEEEAMGTEDETDSSDDLDHYMNKYDRKTSAEEEKRLWKLIRQPCPEHVANALEEDLPGAPKIMRKNADDIVDWRSRCDYKSPWERYGQAYIEGVLPALDVNSGLSDDAGHYRQSSASGSSGSTSVDVSDNAIDDGAEGTNDDETDSRTAEADSSMSSEDTSDAETTTRSRRRLARGRARRRSSSLISYVYEAADDVPRPKDLPSDSEDDFQPTA